MGWMIICAAFAIILLLISSSLGPNPTLFGREGLTLPPWAGSSLFAHPRMSLLNTHRAWVFWGVYFETRDIGQSNRPNTSRL